MSLNPMAPECCGRPMDRWDVWPFNWRCGICKDLSQAPTSAPSSEREASMRLLLGAGWVQGAASGGMRPYVPFTSRNWSGRPILMSDDPAPWSYVGCGSGEYRAFSLRALVGRLIETQIWHGPEAPRHMEVLALASLLGSAHVCLAAAAKERERPRSTTWATFTPLDGSAPTELTSTAPGVFSDALPAAAPKEAVAIEAKNPPPREQSPLPEPLSFNELAFAVLSLYRDFGSSPAHETEERLRRLCERIDASMEP